MDKLKHFIDTNREAFEDDLLPEGHFERFEQKLAAPRKSRAIRSPDRRPQAGIPAR